MQCVFSADEIVRMRASDALEKVCRSRPALLQPFVPRLLGEMSRIEQASVQWHLAQILTEVRLDGNWIGLPEFVMPGVQPVAVCGQGFACQAVSGIQGSPSAARVRASRALMPWRAVAR